MRTALRFPRGVRSSPEDGWPGDSRRGCGPGPGFRLWRAWCPWLVSRRRCGESASANDCNQTGRTQRAAEGRVERARHMRYPLGREHGLGRPLGQKGTQLREGQRVFRGGLLESLRHWVMLLGPPVLRLGPGGLLQSPGVPPRSPGASPRSPVRRPRVLPAHPDSRPTHPDSRPAHPDARPAHPDARPTHPDCVPTLRDARPAQPDERPSRWEERWTVRPRPRQAGSLFYFDGPAAARRRRDRS